MRRACPDSSAPGISSCRDWVLDLEQVRRRSVLIAGENVRNAAGPTSPAREARVGSKHVGLDWTHLREVDGNEAHVRDVSGPALRCKSPLQNAAVRASDNGSVEAKTISAVPVERTPLSVRTPKMVPCGRPRDDRAVVFEAASADPKASLILTDSVGRRRKCLRRNRGRSVSYLWAVWSRARRQVWLWPGVWSSCCRVVAVGVAGVDCRFRRSVRDAPHVDTNRRRRRSDRIEENVLRV